MTHKIDNNISTGRQDSNNLSERSAGIQEIISGQSDYLAVWALPAFIAILLTIMYAIGIIKYNETIERPLTIISSSPPENIRVKYGGQLIKLLVKDNDTVSQGQVLAVINDDNTYVQVMECSAIIDSMEINSAYLSSPENV